MHKVIVVCYRFLYCKSCLHKDTCTYNDGLIWQALRLICPSEIHRLEVLEFKRDTCATPVTVVIYLPLPIG